MSFKIDLENIFIIILRIFCNHFLQYLILTKQNLPLFFIEGIFGLKRRIINFPNIFSYAYSISKIDSLNLSDFGKLASSNNKMQIDFDERKFKSNSYSSFLEERLNLLISDYDKLYKIDIHSYYKSIYTHVFEKLSDTNLKKN